MQEHTRSGPSSSSGASSHHHDDRPRPPARLHSLLEVALRDGPTRAIVAAAVPRVDARFHLGGKSPAGGRRARRGQCENGGAQPGHSCGSGFGQGQRASNRMNVQAEHRRAGFAPLFMCFANWSGGGAQHGALPPTTYLHSAAAGRVRLVGARLALEARPPRYRTRCRRLRGRLHLKKPPLLRAQHF